MGSGAYKVAPQRDALDGSGMLYRALTEIGGDWKKVEWIMGITNRNVLEGSRKM